MFKWLWGKVFGERQEDPLRPMTHEDRRRISEEDTESAHTSSSGAYGEKGRRYMTDGKVPLLTFRTAGLGILTSMGGFIFGYDTVVHRHVDGLIGGGPHCRQNWPQAVLVELVRCPLCGHHRAAQQPVQALVPIHDGPLGCGPFCWCPLIASATVHE
ncbi:hypothetical protein AAP_01078 [Ascosphaera apis ARSEF 7405]|uniref:General substrate transporter n=1 Tax=Ascosphaera apis ARSEF 7405 TaxID=392613 RepID=A0A168C945_9EURO|nr:hypothetical protein AAP_01078 [Ascosphaera apis ARSEF 7405]